MRTELKNELIMDPIKSYTWIKKHSHGYQRWFDHAVSFEAVVYYAYLLSISTLSTFCGNSQPYSPSSDNSVTISSALPFLTNDGHRISRSQQVWLVLPRRKSSYATFQVSSCLCPFVSSPVTSMCGFIDCPGMATGRDLHDRLAGYAWYGPCSSNQRNIRRSARLCWESWAAPPPYIFIGTKRFLPK